MVVPQPFGAALDERLKAWRRKDCPFCHVPPRPTWLSFFTSVTISCTSCDRVIEAFEITYDERGHAVFDNHVFPS